MCFPQVPILGSFLIIGRTVNASTARSSLGLAEALKALLSSLAAATNQRLLGFEAAVKAHTCHSTQEAAAPCTRWPFGKAGAALLCGGPLGLCHDKGWLSVGACLRDTQPATDRAPRAAWHAWMPAREQAWPPACWLALLPRRHAESSWLHALFPQHV